MTLQDYASIALGVGGPLLLAALLVAHYTTRTWRPAPARVLQPDGATPVDVEVPHVEVSDTVGLAGFVAPLLLDLDETPAGPLLCDQPARPPYHDEAWWPMVYAAGRRNDRRRADTLWTRLTPVIGAEWAALIAEAVAEQAEFHRLTELVFESTSELPLVPSLAGAR